MEPLAHASIALLAKPLANKAPLWALLAATQVPDLLGIPLIAVGIERGAESKLDFVHGLQYLNTPSIAWSHGIFMSVVWSLLVAASAYYFSRDRRVSLLIGLMVLSHWLLDFIVYRNMPIFFESPPRSGLGLITSPPGLIVGILMEVGLIAASIAIIVRQVMQRRKKILA